MYLLTVTRPGASHTAEIVASEVDQHHVLGALLGVPLELLGEDRVLASVGAARARAGDRVRGQLVAIDLDAGAPGCAPTTSNVGVAREEQVRGRVDPAERAVQADAVERPARRGVDRQIERLAPGEDDLDRLAGGDRVLGDLDRADVLVAPEAGFDGRGAQAGRRAVWRHAVRRRTTRHRATGSRAARSCWAPAISAADGREVRSSASKIAASAIR